MTTGRSITCQQPHRHNSSLMLQLFLVISFSILLVEGFNLDTRIPVYKFGPKDSYFGFSVAEHVTLNKDRRTEDPV